MIDLGVVGKHKCGTKEEEAPNFAILEEYQEMVETVEKKVFQEH
jgi:hypothetical protein